VEQQTAPERATGRARAEAHAEDAARRRAERPPGSGWELGAAGLGKVSWLGVALFLVAIGVVLLIAGYIGYGAMILVLALAAGANLR